MPRVECLNVSTVNYCIGPVNAKVMYSVKQHMGIHSKFEGILRQIIVYRLFVCLFIPFNVPCKSKTIVGRLGPIRPSASN